MTAQLGLAFLGGVLAFLSPCVAPILPGVVAAVAGSHAVVRLTWSTAARLAAFALGAAVVLVGSVTLALALGMRFDLQSPPWSIVVGGVLVAIGAVGLRGTPLHLPVLDRGSGILRALVLGASCAAAWYPCIGPSLVAVFGLASRVETSGAALLLATAYVAGLCVPLVALGSLLVAVPRVRRLATRFGALASTALALGLIAMGILIATGWWVALSLQLTRAFPAPPL